MRDGLFQKVLSVLLCAVLLMGAFPVHSHAEALDESQRQAILNREMDSWYFPLPEECFDRITDLAGCRGGNENVLYGGSNDSCGDESHNALDHGSEELIVDAPFGQPVYAPASGTLYFAGGFDTKWSGAAVIEVPYDSNYSYYLLLSGLSTDGGSGSYVEAGSVIGYTGGTFRFACLMDYAGMASQIAQDADAEVGFASGFGWLVGGSGTGLICVNPSEEDGPISYRFVSNQQPDVPPVEEPTDAPPVEVPTETSHEHSWQAESTVPATHTADGYIHYTCSGCDASYDDILYADKDAHVFDQQIIDDAHLAASATCGSPAWYYYGCTCGAIGQETYSYGEASGSHSWNGGEIIVPASHTSTGTIRYTCTSCNASYDDTIPADGNAHVFDQQIIDDAHLASPATCGSPASYYYGCACGAIGQETYSYGEASGSHSWNGGEIIVPASHTSTGTIRYTCTACNASYDDAIPADGNAHVFDQQIIDDAHLASPATCGSPASYYYGCACGAIGQETYSYGEASGSHSWNGGEITVPASHTAPGSIHYICTVCNASYDDTIPANPEHTFDQEVVSKEYLASDATCSGPAQYYYSCLCGEKGSATFAFGESAAHAFSDSWSHDETYHWRAATCQHTGETTDFGPHKWDDGVITKDAGHNVNGEKRYTCTVCGFQKTEGIPGQPHEYNQEVVSREYLVSAATCTAPAQYYKSCVCGEKGSETFSFGEAKGHTFSDKWSSDENQHWLSATCEHTGERIKVAEHIWSPGVITKEPTATAKGEKTYTCTVCGRTKTEEVEPSTHQHTFTDRWSGNSTYHWHEATCEHKNVVSGLGEHSWDQGTGSGSHTANSTRVYTCTVCGIQKTEAVAHTYNQQVASSTYLATNATCTNPATYYYSCTCGAKGTETFSFGSALGHVASSAWGKDANYHWSVCSRCGAKGNLTAHSFDANGNCTVCGGSKQDSHVHSSHLSRVPAKAPTCTQEGNISYYICDCGTWFTDVTTTTPITDRQSVVQPATGHVDQDNNGRCDVCKERLDSTVEYQMTEGGESTWLNTSDQGMVFRSNADYSKFDHVEVDGATVSATNYSVSQGSTIVELSNSYLKRLSLGRHTISIVAKDGRATTGFTIKQGATSAATKGGSGIWLVILFLTVVIAIAIPVAYGVYYYRKKTGSY